MRRLLINLPLLFALLGPVNAWAAAETAIQSFSSALQAGIEDPTLAFSMQIQCTDEKGIRSLRLYPNGVVIWNNERQARTGPEDRGALLQLLVEAGFASFKDHYGGKKIDEKSGAPIIVLCSIDVQAGGFDKSSFQDVNGERSKAFMALAASLLDRVEPLTAGGTGAQSFDDGLAKLAAGDLAPEAFTLRLMYMPADVSTPGTILNVESGQLSRQEYRPGVKVGEPRMTKLQRQSFEQLLSAISAAHISDMPANLSTPDTYQLKIGVLQHQQAVRARARATSQAASSETSQATARLILLADTIIGLK